LFGPASDRDGGVLEVEKEIHMLLLIILVVLLFGGGGGYYGYSRWGTRGGLGLVGTVVLILVVLYLVGGLRL
jgi:hypothetical protein